MQVFADVKPVTLAYTPEEKVSFLVRKHHRSFLDTAKLKVHYDKKVRLPCCCTLHATGGKYLCKHSYHDYGCWLRAIHI